jgi:phage tail sheath protein FI
MCEKHDAALPIFEERQGFFIVTFNVSIAEAAEITSKAPVMAPVTAPVTAPVRRFLELLFSKGTLGNLEILAELGLKNRRRMCENYIATALGAGLIEYTISDKPNSRLQKYRLTLADRAVIEGEGKA